jgi:hypothetical protein
MHTLLDLRGNIPSFIHISNGKLHDVHALDMLLPEAGAIYVMDRAYVDFSRLHRMHRCAAFFVTRAKSNLKAHRVYSAATDRATGVIADQTIALDGPLARQDYPDHLRRIRFRDPDSQKSLIFLTNQTDLPALTICLLYKSRWRVDIDQAWRLSRIKGWVGSTCTEAFWVEHQSRPNPRGRSASDSWSTRSRHSSMASRRSAIALSARLAGRLSRHS